MKLAFDIGCNVGKYTEKLLEAGYDKVIAVDPNPFLFPERGQKVVREFKCVSDSKEEYIPFYVCDQTHTISSANKKWTTDSRFVREYSWREYKVLPISIDKLVEFYGTPSHIKIDVEGYELNALKSMSKAYSDEICFEWAEELGEEALQCVDYLFDLGYRRFGFLITDPYLQEPDEYYRIEKFKQIFKYDKDRKDLWGMIWAKKEIK